MKIDPLKSGFRVMDLLTIKVLEVSTLTFHAGCAGDGLLGPYFIPLYLTGLLYHSILRNVFPELLPSVALQTGIRLWLMHDCASPHFLLAV